jgi:hypothetical protein
MSVAELTADDLADLRGDLADNGDTQAFTDAELARLWVRAGGDLTAATLLAVRQLLANAAKFNDYALGQGARDEKKSQIFDHLVKWEAQLAARVAASGSAVAGGATLILGRMARGTVTDEFAG